MSDDLGTSTTDVLNASRVVIHDLTRALEAERERADKAEAELAKTPRLRTAQEQRDLWHRWGRFKGMTSKEIFDANREATDKHMEQRYGSAPSKPRWKAVGVEVYDEIGSRLWISRDHAQGRWTKDSWDHRAGIAKKVADLLNEVEADK